MRTSPEMPRYIESVTLGFSRRSSVREADFRENQAFHRRDFVRIRAYVRMRGTRAYVSDFREGIVNAPRTKTRQTPVVRLCTSARARVRQANKH